MAGHFWLCPPPLALSALLFYIRSLEQKIHAYVPTNTKAKDARLAFHWESLLLHAQRSLEKEIFFESDAGSFLKQSSKIALYILARVG